MTQRKTLAHFGPKRGGVRVLDDPKDGRVWVQWYKDGLRHVKIFPRTTEGRAEAKAWAKGFADQRGQPEPSRALTLRELWRRYAEAEFPHLRPRTQQLYREHWDRWELFLGRGFIADEAKMENLDQFRAVLRRHGLAVSHQQRIIRDVKIVYAWADSREFLVPGNRLAGYRFKIAKESRPKKPAEYRRSEVEKILAQLSPQKSEEWRPWAVLTIAAFQGARERAILHLTWHDIDVMRGRITWQARFDKQGNEWTQPITLAAYSALLTARYWRQRDGARGAWLFYSPWATKKCGREEPGVYGAQALWLALKKAEERARVAHQPFRALHGFRRGVAGDVARASGDAWLGVQYIGDTDADRIPEYVQRRDDTLADAVDMLDRTWAVPTPETKPETVTRPSPAPVAGDGPSGSDWESEGWEAPEAGLEPATRRLTAGCSTS